MKYFRKLAGERIYLSPLSEEDAEQYAAWMNDPSVGDKTGATSRMVTLAVEKDWLVQNRSSHLFAIVLCDGDRLIGNCGFNEINQLHRKGLVGIFIGDARNRGKGYGAEALCLLLKYGFNSLNLHSISLNVFSFNGQAIACYKKCGFRETGRLRESYFCNGRFYDEIKMDILEDEFRAAKQ